MRLIDADALMELYADSKDFSIAMCNVPIPIIRQNILDMPTIDAVPVVRCKDCLYSTDSWAKVNEKGFLICPASGMEITDMDFCSYGERR